MMVKTMFLWYILLNLVTFVLRYFIQGTGYIKPFIILCHIIFPVISCFSRRKVLKQNDRYASFIPVTPVSFLVEFLSFRCLL